MAEENTDPEAGKAEGSEKEKQTVPIERFNAVVAKLKALTEKVEAVTAKGTPRETAKSWTRAELQAEVDAGRLTKDQATDVWDRQREAKVTETAVSAFLQVSQQEKRRGEIALYEKAVPELSDDSSPAFQKVRKEYGELLKLGLPDSLETQIAALRSCFGPVETLRSSHKREPEPMSETVGGGGETVEVAKGLKLDERQKAFYEKAMKAGVYRSWDDVKAEREAVAKRRGR